MGTGTARITAADFVTPPELQDRRLADNAAGRIGGVRLELAAGAAGTCLGACYQQVPLRVLPPFRFGPERPALLYLLNPTAGLMDGDAQLVHLAAGPGTRALVTGQSATRIHPCLRGFSTQQWHLRVAAGAVVVVLPGPAIPFQGCCYYQRVVIDLEVGAGLVWGDLWLAGRYARGEASEQFQFATLVQDLTVRRDTQLVFRDRFCWQGPWDRDTAAWHFGGAPACGSLFATGPVDSERLSPAAAVDQAQFATAQGDTCLRWTGPSAAVTACLVDSAFQAAAVLSSQPADGPWLPADALAPNHWFSDRFRVPETNLRQGLSS